VATTALLQVYVNGALLETDQSMQGSVHAFPIHSPGDGGDLAIAIRG
jgi:hypothetical protein